MARKKLLSEGEIRQFMKLANLRPIGDHRIKRLVEQPEDEEMEMDMGAPGEGEEEMPMDDELPEDDMGAEEMEMDMEEEDDQMISLDDFMSALEMAVEDVTGEPASVEEVPGEEEEEEEDMEMDMEEEPMPEEGDEEMAMDEEPPGMRYENRRRHSNQQLLVSEVSKRVAARLSEVNRKEQMADQLAERIMRRLTK
jgi:hypothetical protein